MFNLIFALKNLRRRLLRTALSVISTGIAISAYILLSSLSESVKDLAGVNAGASITPIISVLTMSLSILVILCASQMNFSERTREIGLLRAVGWGRSKVLFLFLTEGLWVGLIGFVLGIFAGSLGIYAIPSLQFTPISIAFDLDPGTYGKAFFLSLVLGILGGFYPAHKASGISPAESLRHE